MCSDDQCDLFSDDTLTDVAAAHVAPTGMPEQEALPAANRTDSDPRRQPEPSDSRTDSRHPKRPAKGPARRSAQSRAEQLYLTVKQVADRYSVSVATIWRWQSENPDFPNCHKLTPGTSRWFRGDLDAFDQKLRGDAS